MTMMMAFKLFKEITSIIDEDGNNPPVVINYEISSVNIDID